MHSSCNDYRNFSKLFKYLEVWGRNSPLSAKILNCKIGTDCRKTCYSHHLMLVPPSRISTTEATFQSHIIDSTIFQTNRGDQF